MKQSISFCQFTDAFQALDRQGQFTYNGKKALYEHLEELEESTGEAIDLDVIALCCEYAEYGSIEKCEEEMGLDENEKLEDLTIIIEFSSGIIIQQF